MITKEEYLIVFEYLVKHNHTIRAWFDQYASILEYFTVNSITISTEELVLRLLKGNTSDLQVPASFPLHLHTDALETIKNSDIASLLLRLKLGVDI